MAANRAGTYAVVQDDFVLFNQASVSLEDRAVQFGDGVYEVARVYDGRVFALAAHCQRMLEGAGALGIPCAVDGARMAEVLQALVKKNGQRDGIVYWQLTRGTAPRGHAFPPKAEPTFLAYTRDYAAPRTAWETGATACVERDVRWLLCHIKSVNLLGNVLAKQAAVDKGCAEALLERDGVGVVEGSSSNLFIVRSGELWTAPLSHWILPGITRAILLQLAEKLQIPVRETYFDRKTLLTADEVFVTSTGIEVLPLVRVDDQAIGTGTPGTLTRRLQQEYRRWTAESIGMKASS